MTFICNLIFKIAIFPSYWKRADVIPIFKGKGLASNPESYRPIALLSVISKVVESALLARMRSICNNGLSDEQHGFRSGRCTVTNLCMSSAIHDALESRNQIDIIYIDFS